MKTVARWVLLLVAVTSGVLVGLEYGPGWGLLGFVGTYIAFILTVVVVLFAYALVVPYGPIWFQRPMYYRFWKESVQNKHKNNPIHPLVDFPLSLFIQIQLDKEFEKGGLRQAQKALRDWLDEYPDKLMGVFKSFAANKKAVETK